MPERMNVGRFFSLGEKPMRGHGSKYLLYDSWEIW